MKNTMKKIVALLLTVVMVASMFVVGAGAETVTVTEDFSQAPKTFDGETYAFEMNSGWRGQTESGKGTPGGFSFGNSLQIGLATSGTATVYQILAPNSLQGVKNYTFTGKVSVNNTNVKNYLRIGFSPNGNSGSMYVDLVYLHAGNEWDNCLRVQGSNHKEGDASQTNNGTFDLSKPICFEVTRAEDKWTVIFYPEGNTAQDDAAVKTEVTIDPARAALKQTVPGIRIQQSTAQGSITSSAGSIKITFDDLSVQYDGTASSNDKTDVSETPDGVLPGNWHTHVTDFNNGDFIDGKYDIWSWDTALASASIAAGNNNNALKISHDSSLGNSRLHQYLNVAKADLDFDLGTNYTIGFDLFIDDTFKNTSGYHRIHLRPFGTAGDLGAWVDIRSSGIYVQVNGGPASGTVSIEDYDNQELRVEYTRQGQTGTISLWVKGDKTNTLLTSTFTSISDFSTKTVQPAVRFETNVNEGAYWLDNLTIANVDGSTSMVAAQASVEAEEVIEEGATYTDNLCSVRFIATIDSLNYSKAGFKVNAAWGDGETLSWYVDDCVAYNAISANENGVNKEYTATQLGGKYLIAVTLTNIPKDIANGMTLTAEAFVISQDGYATVYSGEGAVDITVTDGVVGLAAAAN